MWQGDILQCLLFYLWTLFRSYTDKYGRGLWVAVFSFVEHCVFVLQEVLHCKFPEDSEDNTVWNKTDFDCLDSRRDLEGSVRRKCKHWRQKWISRWILRDFRPSQRLCWNSLPCLLVYISIPFEGSVVLSKRR
jgi:hypothetical protein